MKRSCQITSIVIVLLCACCSAGEIEFPTHDDLLGSWVHFRNRTVQVLEFSTSNTDFPELLGKSNTYRLYRYENCNFRTIVEVQRGTYSIRDRRLITEVLGSLTGSQIGQTFETSISGHVKGIRLSLSETNNPPDGRSEYTKNDDIAEALQLAKVKCTLQDVFK